MNCYFPDGCSPARLSASCSAGCACAPAASCPACCCTQSTTAYSSRSSTTAMSCKRTAGASKNRTTCRCPGMQSHWLELSLARESSRGRRRRERIIAHSRVASHDQDSTLLFRWQLPNAARPHRFAAFRARNGGKAECKTRKIVSRAVRWLALLGNRGQQLRHRSVESIGKPRALQPWSRETVRRRHLDTLEVRARSRAAYRARVANDECTVEVVEAREPVEDKRHLRRLILDDRLREKGRHNCLRRRSRHRCKYPPRNSLVHHRAHEIEPADRKIV